MRSIKLIAVAALVMTGMALNAQSSRASDTKVNTREEMDAFFKEIGVTEEQMTQINDERARVKKKNKSMKKNSVDKAEASNKLKEEHHVNMKKILTEEQYEKYLEKRKEIKDNGRLKLSKPDKPN